MGRREERGKYSEIVSLIYYAVGGERGKEERREERGNEGRRKGGKGKMTLVLTWCNISDDFHGTLEHLLAFNM